MSIVSTVSQGSYYSSTVAQTSDRITKKNIRVIVETRRKKGALKFRYNFVTTIKILFALTNRGALLSALVSN